MAKKGTPAPPSEGARELGLEATAAVQTVSLNSIESTEAVAKPYVVLARKYRPQTFDDLIGQDSMVRTLRNAFSAERIAQGYMLTGVRGVGKTTTARILARALNYMKEGLADRPTTDMPDFGVHCQEIMESRHPDVLEMDAASNTGVDNIREIIESARYKPLSARFKVYVIDEVHMLSKGAFNALLKTLEEPPAHVKFIFATTEVRKVPVTVLSRCQRFDLRRVDVPALTTHFRRIAGKEGWQAEDDALVLIARAAEGSVRDGLSLLDQAAAMGSGLIASATVRSMLGLADRGRLFDLLDQMFRGQSGKALKTFAALHLDGADPIQVLADLAEAVHTVARAKTAGMEAAGEALPAEERRRVELLTADLSVPLLSRAWQMLLKGLEEAGKAPDPLAAAEMVLIRIAYTADLPTPQDVVRALGGAAASHKRERHETISPNGTDEGRVPPGERALQRGAEAVADDHAPAEEDEPSADDRVGFAELEGLAQPLTFADVVGLAGRHRDARLKVHLEEHVSLVRFDPSGSIDLGLLPGAPMTLANELREKINKWTGRRWIIAISTAPGEPPLGEIRRRREAEEMAGIAHHPVVKAVLERFPDAKIAGVRRSGPRSDDDQAAG
jgi:DNA polymerase-3 subunit gamma/tau